jgi:hypothetical protein
MLHAFYHPDQGLRLFTDPAQATAWVEASGVVLAAVFALLPATPAQAGPGENWESALALLRGNYYRMCHRLCYRWDEWAFLVKAHSPKRRHRERKNAYGHTIDWNVWRILWRL